MESFLTQRIALQSLESLGHFPCSFTQPWHRVRCRLCSFQGPFLLLKKIFWNSSYLQISHGGGKQALWQGGGFLEFASSSFPSAATLPHKNASLFTRGHMSFTFPCCGEAQCVASGSDVSWLPEISRKENDSVLWVLQLRFDSGKSGAVSWIILTDFGKMWGSDLVLLGPFSSA